MEKKMENEMETGGICCLLTCRSVKILPARLHRPQDRTVNLLPSETHPQALLTWTILDSTLFSNVQRLPKPQTWSGALDAPGI